MDKRHRPDMVKNIASKQIAYGYSPTEVLAALQGQNRRFPISQEILKEAGAYHLTLDDMRNAERKVLIQHPNARFYPKDLDIDIQVEQVLTHLYTNAWRYESLQAIRQYDGELSRSIT